MLAVEKDIDYMRNRLKEQNVEMSLSSYSHGIKFRLSKPKKDGYIVKQDFNVDDIFLQNYGTVTMILKKLEQFLLYYKNVYGD